MGFTHSRWALVGLAVLAAACGEDTATQTTTTATGQNTPPTISGVPGKSVDQNSTYAFVPTASDADGDPIVFGIDARPAWASFDTATGRLSGTPTANDVGVYKGIVIWVSDGKTETLLPAFDLTVNATAGAVNHAPVISGSAPVSVVAGGAYTFTPVATDADGDTLTFSIRNRPAWATFSPVNGRLQGTPQIGSVGSFNNIVISVSDGQSVVAMNAFNIVVTAPSGNSPPVISGAPITAVEAGTPYAFVPTATDADNDTLTFGVTGLPSWAAFNTQSGRLAGTPPAGTTGTFGGIVISVTDGIASVSLPAFSITVTAPTTNTPPTITGAPSTSATQGVQYSFQPAASDADGDPITFSIANRPTWATFNPSTGRLQGTPAASNVRTYSNIVISASDGKASTSLPAFAITVTAANNPPTITGTPGTTATVGTQYTFTPTASDADGDTLTFSITNKPSWATFSTSTGRLQGTPASGDVGTTSQILIGVSDGQASAQLATFAIAVSAAPNKPPTITGTPGTTATVGTQYTFTPTANDADGDTLTFSIVNKPSWATFSTTTGRLRGTPAAGDVGTAAGIVISVSDGQASAQLSSFSIAVSAAPNQPPVISGTPSTAVMQDTQYSFTPTASDPNGDSLTFTIGNKPSWATFNASTGRLQGTPTAVDVGTTAGIVITVSDGQASVALAAFSITVQAVATGSATLSWNPPTQNDDGSPLTDLAGFKVYWGTSQGSYSNSVTLSNPGLTTYVVDNLTSGTYYFVTTAFNSAGGESNYSNVASKTIP